MEEVKKLKVAVFDLDGTLAEVTTRKHMLDNDPPNYEAFNKARMNDTPIWPIVELLRFYMESDEHLPVIVTAADDKFLEEISDYLGQVAGLPIDRVGLEVWAREHGDHRPDHEVKQDFVDHFHENYENAVIHIVFEDRDSVVKMWRDNGFRCLQVANGDF